MISNDGFRVYGKGNCEWISLTAIGSSRSWCYSIYNGSSAAAGVVDVAGYISCAILT